MGRTTRMLYPDGADTKNYYDKWGRLRKTEDPDGIITLFDYNDEGERYRTAIDVDRDNPDPLILSNLTDSIIGDPASEPDRVTETETLVATRDTHNVQRTISRVWTDTGLVTTSINDRSLDGYHSWSERFGQITYTVMEDSDTTDGDWSATTIQPDGSYTVQTYTDGRLTSTVNFDSADVQLASTTITYDSLGRQETITDSRTGTTTLAYYENDALESTTAPDPDGAGSLGTLLTQYLYDLMGRQTQVIHPDATNTYTVYNSKGQVTKTYGSLQNPVEYTYDYAGRQKTMTTWQDFNESTGVGTSGSATTTWIYDNQRGWLERKEYDDGNGTDYTYTPGGRLASRTWARDADPNTTGQQDLTTLYAYNSAGDLLGVDYTDSTTDVHYTYTRTGQQDAVGEGAYASAAFGAGDIFTPASAPALDTTDRSTDYAYNARFQVETETVTGLLTNDAVLTRTYEDGSETNGLTGRASGYSLSTDGATTLLSSSYAYDTAGRLATVSDGTDNFTYGYTANTTNLLASMTGPEHTTTYAYESGRNAMTGIENRIGGTTLLSSYAYTYNALGQRADREQSGSAFSSTTKDTFTYDYLGQVTASANDTETANAYNPTYVYDEIGNRTGNTVDLKGTTTYTQNLLNQYSTISASSAVNPTYDLDGNLTGDGTWTYTWNGENRLISATNGTTTIDFTYDYQGRLIEKDDGSNVEVYLYDGWNRIATFRPQVSALIPHKTYLWGMDLSGSMQGAGGVGGLLKEGSLYPTYDANGNIVQKLNSSGIASMEVEYDPFGNIISGSLVGDYGFSTKPLIDDIQMYYYGFRYYDPVTGRWPSRDPIQEFSFQAQKNQKSITVAKLIENLNTSENLLYTFLSNNPISHIDAFGLDRWVVDQVHSHIVVEVWSTLGGRDVVTGYKRIDFGPVDLKTGLFCPVCGGEVTIRNWFKPNEASNVIHIPSNAQEDLVLLDTVRALKADPPSYNWLAFNCRHFTNTVYNAGFQD